MTLSVRLTPAAPAATAPRTNPRGGNGGHSGSGETPTKAGPYERFDQL